jgi:hypothetical protein
MTLQVDDPRPLEAAVLSLIKRYPVAITYEDPRYEYSDDIEDTTARVLKNPSASSARVLVPRGGVLQADIEISPDSGQPVSIAAAVQGIVNAKNVIPRGGNSGFTRARTLFISFQRQPETARAPGSSSDPFSTRRSLSQALR